MDQAGAATSQRWSDYLDAGHIDDALLHYNLSNERDEEISYSLKSLAAMQDALRSKRWANALKIIQDLENPGQITNWNTLTTELEHLKEAGVALDQREPEQTIELLASIESPFLKGEAETLFGTSQIFLGQNDAAKEAFNKALTHDPKHYRAITNLGNLALEAGQVDEAIAAYEKALKVNESFANALHNLGVAYRKKGKISKSVQYLRKAQRAGERKQREEARETLRQGSSPQMRKYFRWLVYGVAAIIVYLVLRSQGFI